MDETRNSSALILNRQPYRESDSLVTVYTLDFGKLSLVARGTKKLRSKLAAHTEPLSLIDLMIIKGRGFDYVGGAINRDIYTNIREDLNKLYFAGQTLKIFNRLVKDNEADKRLYFLLSSWLEVLNNYVDFDKEKGSLLQSFFVLKFLTELGYKPEMHKCLLCSDNIKSGHNYFDLLSGGVICETCFKDGKRPVNAGGVNLLLVSDNCIKLIRFMLEDQFSRTEKIKIDKKTTKELVVLVDKFLSFCS